MSAASPVPVPEELESVPPGSVLAELLDAVAVEEVSGFDTVRLLEAAYRQLSHVRAVFLSILRETGLRRPGSSTTVERLKAPNEFACEEARAALVWSRTRAASTYGFATDVFERLPILGEAMLAGTLDEPRARAFVEWTRGLTDAQAETVCERLLPEASGLMVGELIDRIKRACLAIDPEWAAKKYQEAVKTRRVAGSRNPDGTANLGGYQQPLDRVAAASEHIDTLARACKRAGDRRPIDHIRSDLFLGMIDGTFESLSDSEIIEHVLANPYSDGGDMSHHGGDGDDSDGPEDGGSGGDPDSGDDDNGDEGGGVAEPDDLHQGSRGDGRAGSGESTRQPLSPAARGSTTRAVPEIRVELAALLGVNEHPGEIPPWGPIPAEQARELVAGMASAEWRYVLCDSRGRPTAGGLIEARPATAARVRRDRRRGGIVELAVPTAQLSELVANQPPDSPWAPVLTELAQHAERASHQLDTDSRDAHRRTAGAALRRWVAIRDRQCVHPCCRMPAAKADQDHRIRYAAGGATVGANLSSPCRHDHRLKDEAGWLIEQPEPGLTVWTSPLGHRHESRPPPVIVELPEPWPDLDQERLGMESRLVWQSGPAGCACPECDSPGPILPPSPERIPVEESAGDRVSVTIFDLDEPVPF